MTRRYPNVADTAMVLDAMQGMRTRNQLIASTGLRPEIVDRALRLLKLTERAEPVGHRPTQWRRLP